MTARPTKITFADLGVHGLVIYCSDYKCSHLITMSGDRWSDEMRLFDIEPRFICSACGKRGADVCWISVGIRKPAGCGRGFFASTDPRHFTGEQASGN